MLLQPALTLLGIGGVTMGLSLALFRKQL
jgi:hypothetical protein